MSSPQEADHRTPSLPIGPDAVGDAAPVLEVASGVWCATAVWSTDDESLRLVQKR